MEDTYLYKIFGKSFIRTISDDIEYTIYINVDTNDPIYSKTVEKNKFRSLIGEKAKIKFISDGHISKGYLTQMWNYLFRLSYEMEMIIFINVEMILCFKILIGYQNALSNLKNKLILEFADQ